MCVHCMLACIHVLEHVCTLYVSKPDIAIVTHGNYACAFQKHVALINKDGHNFECSSVRFEACVEFSAKTLHKQR